MHPHQGCIILKKQNLKVSMKILMLLCYRKSRYTRRRASPREANKDFSDSPRQRLPSFSSMHNTTITSLS